MAYVRTVKTSSGATAVQLVHSSRRGSRKIEHLGSAHTPEEVEALKIVAKERIEAGQAELDLGLEVAEAASSGRWGSPARKWGTCGRVVSCLRCTRVPRHHRWG